MQDFHAFYHVSQSAVGKSHKSFFGQMVLSVYNRGARVFIAGKIADCLIENYDENEFLIVVVHAGEVIPVDGTVVEGAAFVDQRMLTGEAQPVEKGPRESVGWVID